MNECNNYNTVLITMQVYINWSFSYNFLGDRLSGGGGDEPPKHLLFYLLYTCICVTILAKMYSLVLQET